MKRLLLVPLFVLPFFAFGAPAHAASYCDSYGRCTGPSANDWNRWLWANDPGYNGFIYQPGYYVPRSYYPYSPYGYQVDPYYGGAWEPMQYGHDTRDNGYRHSHRYQYAH